MLATGALRTCLVIVSHWDHLVDIEKFLEATKTICWLQPISLILFSVQYTHFHQLCLYFFYSLMYITPLNGLEGKGKGILW